MRVNSKMSKRWATALGFITACFMVVPGADAFSLRGTVWERASLASECRPDPLLLYSLALQESRTGVGTGLVAPHPFALRNAPRGAAYPATAEEARALLPAFIEEDRLTDIGVMQINYRWNGNRVSDVVSLLDIEVNVRVGAEILCESIRANRADMLLAIGGYHTRNPRHYARARDYARQVLSIWRALQRIAGEV